MSENKEKKMTYTESDKAAVAILRAAYMESEASDTLYNARQYLQDRTRYEQMRRSAETTLKIMAAALPVVEAVPMSQDSCWPGDGPAHDDDCALPDHTASVAAVAATQGLSWDFATWTATAAWFRAAIEGAADNTVEA